MKDIIRDHKDRAADHLNRGKFDLAVREFQEVLKADPADHATRQRMADAMARAGQKAAAVAEYQRVAGTFAKQGLLLKAIAVSKVILQLDAKQTATRDALAQLYAQRMGGSGAARPVHVPAVMAASMRAPPAPSGSAPPASELAEDSIEIMVETQSDQLGLDVAALPRIPLFTDLSEPDFIALADGMQVRQVAKGEVVVREGDTGDSMFAIVQGSVVVVRGSGAQRREVDAMQEGSFFGEMAILAQSPRLATIEATDTCTLLELSRETIARVSASHPSIPRVLERFYKARLMANAMRSNPLFAALDEGGKAAAQEAFHPRVFQPGDDVQVQGVMDDHLGLVLRGRCRAFLRLPDGTEVAQPDLEEGALLGETAVALGLPALFHARATAACVVLLMSREDFTRLLWAHERARMHVVGLAQARLRTTASALQQLVE